MSKKDQARIEAFLKAQKITERRLGAYKVKFYESMKQALVDNRLGNKSAVRQEIRKIVASLRVVQAVDEAGVADFVKALAKFISKHGQFSFSKVLAKNARKLGGIATVFHSKGVLAARQEVERLRRVMIDAGDIPAGASIADFEAAMEKHDASVERLYRFKAQNVGKARWGPIIKRYKLKNGAKKDLKTLGMAIYKKGTKHPVVKAMGKDLLAVSGDAKQAMGGVRIISPLVVDEFIALVADELMKAGK